MLTAADVVVIVAPPPFSVPLTLVQLSESKPHPEGMVLSLTVYVWKLAMLSKSCSASPDGPFGVRLKFVTGEGEPV